MNRDRASLLDIARLDIARAAKLVMQFAEGLDRTSLAANEEKTIGNSLSSYRYERSCQKIIGRISRSP